MKRTISAIIVLIGMAAYLFVKLQPPLVVDDRDRSAIQAAYDRQNQAYSRRDIDAIAAVCTPNYEDVNYGKASSLSDFRQALHKLFNYAREVHIVIEIQSARPLGSDIEVKAKRRFEAIFQDRNRKPHKYLAAEILTDTWSRSGDQWLKRRSEVASQAATIDGTPQP
jgi:hypothetical protein